MSDASLTDRWPTRRRPTITVTLAHPSTGADRRARDEATAAALRAYLSVAPPVEHAVDLTI